MRGLQQTLASYEGTLHDLHEVHMRSQRSLQKVCSFSKMPAEELACSPAQQTKSHRGLSRIAPFTCRWDILAYVEVLGDSWGGLDG